MRIVFAYEGDAADISTQSGRPFSILRELERRADVVRVFPLRQELRYLFAGKYLYYRQRGLTYRPDREPLLLKSLARQIERRVRGITADVLFAPGSHAVADLHLPVPMIFCADATFANVLQFYDSFTACAPEFIEQGHAMDRKALAKCAAAIYPSEWAARSAIEDYGADPAKVHVIPFGANMDAPDEARVHALIQARTFDDELRLLFVGRDWYRKGGDIVLATCEELRRRGIPLRLDLVGIPGVPVALPSYAHKHGLLDRKNPTQRARLECLFARAHFLFVPSRAENYGMVFCEAAAFGVPSITTDIGGIPTIVRHGQTGYTISPHYPIRTFADAIERGCRDHAHYYELACLAREDFGIRLNWNAFRSAFMRVATNLARMD